MTTRVVVEVPGDELQGIGVATVVRDPDGNVHQAAPVVQLHPGQRQDFYVHDGQALWVVEDSGD